LASHSACRAHAQDTWALEPPAGWTSTAKETLVIKTGHDIQPSPGLRLRLAAGRWRVDPAQSHASFAARVGGQFVRGRLPLAGRVIIAEPIEDSTACLAARTSAVSTGSPALDRLLAGPRFLDAAAFPEISFRSELLAWVPAGWRAVGRLRVKNAEHELACQFDLHPGDTRPDDVLPDDVRRIVIASNWVIDSRWVTSHWVPALSRNVMMTCSFSLVPEI
jgi:polyisoprenoid-binding protein YceI